MNGGKLPDGGILYDGTEDDDDDVVVEVDVTRPGIEIDWHVDGLDETGLTGAELIAEFVKRLPNAPGVYRMLNKDGEVMYVGKARSLKKRVSNYAQGRVHSNRLSRMVRDTVHMEFVTTRTEVEALRDDFIAGARRAEQADGHAGDKRFAGRQEVERRGGAAVERPGQVVGVAGVRSNVATGQRQHGLEGSVIERAGAVERTTHQHRVHRGG